MRGKLEEQFGGWSLAAQEPLEGAWRNPDTGEVEHDASWRYEVGVAPEQLEKLDGYLADLALRLGQRAIWRVAHAGQGKLIHARGR